MPKREEDKKIIPNESQQEKERKRLEAQIIAQLSHLLTEGVETGATLFAEYDDRYTPPKKIDAVYVGIQDESGMEGLVSIKIKDDPYSVWRKKEGSPDEFVVPDKGFVFQFLIIKQNQQLPLYARGTRDEYIRDLIAIARETPFEDIDDWIHPTPDRPLIDFIGKHVSSPYIGIDASIAGELKEFQEILNVLTGASPSVDISRRVESNLVTVANGIPFINQGVVMRKMIGYIPGLPSGESND